MKSGWSSKPGAAYCTEHKRAEDGWKYDLNYKPGNAKMRVYRLFIFLIGFGFIVATEAASFDYRLNVPYYSDKEMAGDGYMKERCVLDIAYPKDTTNFITVIWFHGGGLTTGDKFIPGELTKEGYAVVAPTYRFSPKVDTAKCIEDAAAAVAWVFAHIAEYGGDPSKIYVSGHSAGGYLTSMIGLDKHWLAARGVDANRIAGLMPLSGHVITHFTRRKELGLGWTQPWLDEMAPLYHIRKDAPPILLITGGRDVELLGRYEETAYFWRMMQVIGHPDTEIHEIEGKDHGGMIAPSFPLMVEWLKKHTARPAVAN
jgi:acetyl esterase/lipase